MPIGTDTQSSGILRRYKQTFNTFNSVSMCKYSLHYGVFFFLLTVSLTSMQFDIKDWSMIFLTINKMPNILNFDYK